MANDADFAQVAQEQELERMVSAARGVVSSRAGERRCLRCDGINDRCEQGYGVCSDCVSWPRC